jgi:hypothetical protein
MFCLTVRIVNRIDNNCVDSVAKVIDSHLQSLANAALQLESTAGLVSSVNRLRVRLNRLLCLLQENSRRLIARSGRSNSSVGYPAYSLYGQERPPSPITDHDILKLPEELSLLAEDVARFLKRLREIPELNDDAIAVALVNLERDLKVGNLLKDLRSNGLTAAIPALGFIPC